MTIGTGPSSALPQMSAAYCERELPLLAQRHAGVAADRARRRRIVETDARRIEVVDHERGPGRRGPRRRDQREPIASRLAADVADARNRRRFIAGLRAGEPRPDAAHPRCRRRCSCRCRQAAARARARGAWFPPGRRARRRPDERFRRPRHRRARDHRSRRCRCRQGGRFARWLRRPLTARPQQQGQHHSETTSQTGHPAPFAKCFAGDVGRSPGRRVDEGLSSRSTEQRTGDARIPGDDDNSSRGRSPFAEVSI